MQTGKRKNCSFSVGDVNVTRLMPFDFSGVFHKRSTFSVY